MSKKSRRKSASDNAKDGSGYTSRFTGPTPGPTPEATARPDVGAAIFPASWTRGFLARLARRRKTWLLAVCLLGGVGVLVYNSLLGTRPGYLEFSSEEPDAQVVIEKDGIETPLERTEKTTRTLEPGNYKLRLATPNDNLKLQPTWFNLDPNGRAFVKVRKLKSS